MNKKKLFPASLLAIFALLLTFSLAIAHEHVPVGNYELVIGWAAEPPVAGSPNAIIIRIEDTKSTDKEKEIDASKLTATVAYGGQTKPLTLEKSWGTVNQYQAQIIPSIAGKYTLQLRGKIGDTEVNVDAEPEEVTAIEALAFPSLSAAQPTMRITDFIGIGALLVALVALVLALRKPRS